VDFVRVHLGAASARLTDLATFYGGLLGLETPSENAFAVGRTELVFEGADGEPFSHFALLVPGDRFDAALAWAHERVELLGDAFDFDAWNARAFYFHDPAGNIVELIAHRGLGESGATGPFEPGELLGFSEVGLVGDPKRMARDLERLGLELWDGTVDEPGRIGFVGEQARTLILSPAGRGWLPTGRAAEAHPVDVTFTGPPAGEVTTDGHRVRRV
jgi:catechol 2,3-dioxygenase-like lactoylglutathione lyase family enzyme